LSEVVVIGDEDTVTGFRLAGIRNTLVHEEASKTEAYIWRVLEKDVGVVIITERVAEQVRDLLDRIRREKARVKPVFVEIPDKRGPMGEDRLRELVRRIIGTEISLEAGQ